MVLKPDPWLGGFLGKDAWHLSVSDPVETSVPLPSATPCFVDVKVPVNEIVTANRMQAAGFRLIDTNIQLERPSWPVARSRTARFALEPDRDAIERIAGSSFTTSRFHLDPEISKEAADAIKREWAGNFFAGARGTHMVVSQQGEEIAGFLQLIQQAETLVIDLIAVDARFRGKGLARDMIAFAENHIPGVERLKVGTQAANAQSLHAYVANKFQFMTATYIFHFHG
ncbi:GNAT family N-acetyltransferase [Minwuia sp.]|uniref:GNAT family N-acetyltransferase n=1 Tax=Minwuia sp. TaxID=2493630 RepID=UPI003A900C07